EQDGQAGDEHLVPHDAREGVDGPVDEPGAVVGRYDAHALGQAGLKLLDLLLDGLGHGERVPAVAHQHGAAGDLVAVLLEDAAADLRAELHDRHVPDVNRGAAALLDDGVLQVPQDPLPGVLAALRVLGGPEPADAADQVLGVALLHDPAADAQVAPGHGVVEVAERDPVGRQVFRPDVDLVLQGRAADRRDLGHAGDRVQLRADVELVQRPQPARIDRPRRAGLDGVPEDLAQGGRVRGQVRDHAGGQVGADLAELLQHPLAGGVGGGAVFEDEVGYRGGEMRW